jgi:ubiquinone/menaquinone biosynthesis C-methylase UbiE
MMTELDYVLGTHDEEIARLDLQHRVWRPRVLDAWRRAGFARGQTILDLGCGPGYAALDLAELVGGEGHVRAFDRSRRFLDVLSGATRARGLSQVETIEADLDHVDLGAAAVDGVWCRWVAAFVARPRDLVTRIRRALKSDGVFVSHEYFDYGTWRLAPPSDELDEFVARVIDSWRRAGGEPNIGLELPAWLEALGFEILSARPLVDVIEPSNPVWLWPRAFIQSGLRRLVELGHLDDGRADEIWRAFEQRERAPHTRMITPAVLEVIARKRSP